MAAKSQEHATHHLQFEPSILDSTLTDFAQDALEAIVVLNLNIHSRT